MSSEPLLGGLGGLLYPSLPPRRDVIGTFARSSLSILYYFRRPHAIARSVFDCRRSISTTLLSIDQRNFEGITRYIALLVPCCRFVFSYHVDLYDASITAIASRLFRNAGSTSAAVLAKARVKYLLQTVLHVRSQLALMKSAFENRNRTFLRLCRTTRIGAVSSHNTKDSSPVDLYVDALCCKIALREGLFFRYLRMTCQDY